MLSGKDLVILIPSYQLREQRGQYELLNFFCEICNVERQYWIMLSHKIMGFGAIH